MDRHCPVHGDPNRVGWDWPCPVAVEGDPPDKETCPHFVEEMERRIAEVAAGNFWRKEDGPDGAPMLAEYVDHKPTGRVDKW